MLIIFLTVFIYLLGFGIVIPIIPLLGREFGANPFQAGLLMSVYSLMQFLFAPFWGKLSDRIGRRPILLGCMLGEGLSYILFAYARNLELLFVARILAGFFGASLSTASAYISDITPLEERSKGMALIGAAFGLGFVFGPAIGGGLQVWAGHISTEPHFGTSFTALWVAGICIVNFAFGLKVLKESLTTTSASAEKKDRFGQILKYLNMPTVGTLIVVFFLTSFAMSSMESTLILFMGEKFSWTIKEVSFGFAYIGVIMVFTQGFLVRRLIPKLGERQTLRLGLISFIIGLGGIAVAPNISLMAVTMTFLAIGTGLVNPSTIGSISILTSSTEQGSSLGVTQGLSSLGRIVGPAFGGFVYQKLSISAPFVTSASLAAIALILVLTIFAKIPDAGKKAA